MSTQTPLDTAPLPAAEAPREELSVTEAKARLAEAFRSVDLLRPLKEHPYVVVGAAATAGAVLGSSGAVVGGLGKVTVGLLRLVKPLSGIVSQVLAAKVAAQTVKPDEPPAVHVTTTSGAPETTVVESTP